MREERVSKFVLSGCPFFFFFPPLFPFFFLLEGKKTKIRERSEREKERDSSCWCDEKKDTRRNSTIATKIRRHES